jgi:uncharacterized damage-inducible protein DinB
MDQNTMNKREYFSKLFAYDDWANRETLSALKSCKTPPAQSLKIMSHIVSAKQLWLDRLRQARQSLAVWPEFNLQECESHQAEISQLWQEYLNNLDPADYSSQVAYTNSKGEVWESKVEDILTQLLTHASYHRGQIALELRASGHAPPYTDFIHAVRQGFIE